MMQSRANRDILYQNEIKQESMNWIIQYLASDENYSLLSSIHSHHPYFNNNDNNKAPQFENKTKRLFLIAKLRNMILCTPYEQLYSYCYQRNNIFIDYHQLYPKSKILDPNWLKSQNRREQNEFSEWVGVLFTTEIELKVQMILSTEFWKNNYVQHKRLNDLLLHPNKYPFKQRDETPTHVPDCDILHFIGNCANGTIFIQRIYQQLDYLGQQCTTKGINLANLQNNTVKKIREFLKKHTFKLFKAKWAQTMNGAQNKVCAKGKDFLTRLMKADINKIISGDFDHNHPPSPFKTTPSRSPPRHRLPPQSPPRPHQHRVYSQSHSPSPSVQVIEKKNQRTSPAKISKFALRTVVDVQIDKNWCSGTIIKRYDNGSVKIALHADELDDDGKYKYDSHTTVPSDRVIHCINEDGEYEMDNNESLTIDHDTASSQFSSPQKQQEIRQEKQTHHRSPHRSPHHSQRDRDQNRNRNRNQNRPQKHRANRTLPSFVSSPIPQRSPQRQRQRQSSSLPLSLSISIPFNC